MKVQIGVVADHGLCSRLKPSTEGEWTAPSGRRCSSLGSQLSGPRLAKGTSPGKARRCGCRPCSQPASEVFVQHGFHDAEEIFQGRLECCDVTFVKAAFAQVRQCHVKA